MDATLFVNLTQRAARTAISGVQVPVLLARLQTQLVVTVYFFAEGSPAALLTGSPTFRFALKSAATGTSLAFSSTATATATGYKFTIDSLDSAALRTAIGDQPELDCTAELEWTRSAVVERVSFPCAVGQAYIRSTDAAPDPNDDATDAWLASKLAAGSNITLSVHPTTGVITIAAAGGAGSGDALVANNLDQFASVTQTAGQTLAITSSTTLAGGTHSGTNTGDQTNITGNAATVTTNANLTGPVTSTGNATAIAAGAITNAMLANAAVANLSGSNTGDQSLAAYLTSATAATTYQPLDADLTSIAGLTKAGNTLKVIRVNAGETAYELATVTSGSGDALVANNLDQFADVTQTAGQTLAITSSTTLAGGTHSGTNTGDQSLAAYLTSTLASTTYQPLDADLTRLATLSTSSMTGGSFAMSPTSQLFLLAGNSMFDGDATTAPGGSPGTVTLIGGNGYAESGSNYPGGDAGGISMGGGSAALGFNGGTGGNINTSGSGTYSGGNLNLNSTGTSSAGSVTTSAGGSLTMGTANIAGGNIAGTILTTAGSAASLTDFPTLNQNTTGSAATLTTARTINGTSFNGSANITVTAAGSTLSDTVPATKGGTGLTAIGTALQVLRTNAGATSLEFATLAGGGNAQTADPLSQFAATTSAQLAGVMSDETGSGALVFATSPTLVTPALGTPSSGNLASCTFPTLNQNTSGYAEALKSATTTVSVSASTAPTSGQVLTATSGTAATWQTPSGGGGGLTNITETLVTSAPNATVNAEKLAVTGGTTNADLVLTPKGTGAFILGPSPDSTGTGGNKRGQYSVDLQINKSATADRVASGNYSFLAGLGGSSTADATTSIGQGNLVTSNYAVGLGYGNSASGTAAISLGYSNANSGTVSVALGQSNTVSNNRSYAIGNSNTASGDASGAMGDTCTASAKSALATGLQALASRYGQRSHSAGQFAAVGDAQAVKFVLRCKTTTNAAVEMMLDGSATRLTIISGKVLSGIVQILGMKSDGTVAATYLRQVAIKNVAGTTSLIGTVNTLGTDETGATSLSITANDTNDAINISPTGIAAQTWRWIATFDGVEIAYGA